MAFNPLSKFVGTGLATIRQRAFDRHGSAPPLAPLQLKARKRGAGAKLVAYRLAGLSALVLDYGVNSAPAQSKTVVAVGLAPSRPLGQMSMATKMLPGKAT
jgi:hypothetical protein